MKPSVGRIVHYIGYGEVNCVAAMVTEVDLDGLVSLSVFPAGSSMSTTSDISFSEEKIDCTWHWPEREE